MATNSVDVYREGYKQALESFNMYVRCCCWLTVLMHACPVRATALMFVGIFCLFRSILLLHPSPLTCPGTSRSDARARRAAPRRVS